MSAPDAEAVVFQRLELGCVVEKMTSPLLLPVVVKGVEEIRVLELTTEGGDERTGAVENGVLELRVGSGEDANGVVDTVPVVVVLADDSKALPVLLECGPITEDGRELAKDAAVVKKMDPDRDAETLERVAVDCELSDSRLVPRTIETEVLDEEAFVVKEADPGEDAETLERVAVDCELNDSKLVSTAVETEVLEVEKLELVIGAHVLKPGTMLEGVAEGVTDAVSVLVAPSVPAERVVGIETGAEMTVVHDAVVNSEFEVQRPETRLVEQLVVVVVKVFVSLVVVSASTPKIEASSSIRTIVGSIMAERWSDYEGNAAD